MAQGDTPHDRFFRSVFTRPELAGALERALADPGARELGHQVERLYATTRSRHDIELMATIAAHGEYHSAEEGLVTYAEELLREARQEGELQG